MVRDAGGKEGRGLRETVELNEVPAEFHFESFDERCGGRGARHGKTRLGLDLEFIPSLEVEDGPKHGRRHAREGDAFAGDEFEDSAVVHGPQNHVRSPHAGECVDAPPTVAMEHGQGPEFHVIVPNSQVGDEAVGVDVEIAVREHHALGAGRCSRCVVEGDSIPFVFWSHWRLFFIPLNE